MPKVSAIHESFHQLRVSKIPGQIVWPGADCLFTKLTYYCCNIHCPHSCHTILVLCGYIHQQVYTMAEAYLQVSFVPMMLLLQHSSLLILGHDCYCN